MRRSKTLMRTVALAVAVSLVLVLAVIPGGLLLSVLLTAAAPSVDLSVGPAAGLVWRVMAIGFAAFAGAAALAWLAAASTLGVAGGIAGLWSSGLMREEPRAQRRDTLAESGIFSHEFSPYPAHLEREHPIPPPHSGAPPYHTIREPHEDTEAF